MPHQMAETQLHMEDRCSLITISILKDKIWAEIKLHFDFLRVLHKKTAETADLHH